MGEATTARHTPGPWYPVVNDLIGGWAVSTVNVPMSNVDVRTGNVVPADFIANESDARLIAAAPDLLAALKEVVAVTDRKTIEFGRAHAAIAKAECRAAKNGGDGGLADLLEDEARRETGR